MLTCFLVYLDDNSCNLQNLIMSILSCVNTIMQSDGCIRPLSDLCCKLVFLLMCLKPDFDRLFRKAKW